METISNILNRHIYPYERRITNIEGLTIISTIDSHLSRILPAGGDEIISMVSRPVRTEQLCMLYCYGGQISCRLNMIEYTLRRDDFLFIRENSIVEFIVSDPAVNLVGLLVSEGFRPVDVGMKEYLALHELIVRTPLVHLDTQTAKAFVDTCSLLEDSVQCQRDPFTDAFARAYMLVLYLHLARAINSYNDTAVHFYTRVPRRMEILTAFFDLVEKHFSSRRDVGFYAEKLCLAPKYASQVIRQASGKMPADWIRERVILEAKLLLLDGRHNVQQVSDALGFPSQSAFGKYFKQATGISPRDYYKGYGL